MDELAQVLAGVAALRGEMERLAAEIPGVLPVRVRLSPPPGKPIPQPDPRTPLPPVWTPEEVLTRWREAGPALFPGLSRRELGAVFVATADLGGWT